MSALLDSYRFVSAAPVYTSFVAASGWVDSGAANLVLSVPGAAEAGDILLAVVATKNSYTGTDGPIPATGWTLLAQKEYDTSPAAADPMVHIYRHDYTGDTPDLTFPVHSSGVIHAGNILAFRDVGSFGTPVGTSGGNAANHSIPGVTTTGTNSIVLAFFAIGTPLVLSSANFTDPASPTASYYDTVTSNDISCAYAWGVKASAGATGNFTISTPGTFARGVGVVIEIKS